MQKVTIIGKIPTLNEYTKVGRTQGKRNGIPLGAILQNELKRQTENKIKPQFSILKPLVGLNYILIVYYIKDKKKDLDNVAFCKKFIYDALKDSGKISNDGQANIKTLFEVFLIDKKNERIEIFFSSSKEELLELYLKMFFKLI
jgi:Holliday junction resolvase RusA-like endonuclease